MVVALIVVAVVVVVALFIASRAIRIIPQARAAVLERLGRYHRTLEPGLNLIIPFFDKVAYVHSLKEVPLDVPEQVCITKDNTQLAVDGILYYQVTDPRLASYGTSDYVTAIVQLAQTTLRSEVGKMELDQSLQSRDVRRAASASPNQTPGSASESTAVATPSASIASSAFCGVQSSAAGETLLRFSAT